MNSINITRKIEFDAGHRLIGHESKCRNIHGHRYVLEATVDAERLDEVGRLIDFAEIKATISGWVDTRWDHGLILNRADLNLIEFCRGQGHKIYLLDHEPTVENMILELADELSPLLIEKGARLVAMRLFETPNCWADWRL